MQTSAQRKLSRGIEQVKTLRAEAEAFEDDEAYTFRKEVETQTADYVKYRCFATQHRAVPDHWPLLAGEAIQNLRSALDHVVYAAASGRAKTQFPIFTDPCEFQVLGDRMLKGVPAEVRTPIERAQPYWVAPQAPARESLALLRTFSNLDKHRTLATVVSSVQRESIGIRPTNLEVRWEKFGTNVPLGEAETHVSTFVAFFKAAGVKVEDMHVSPGFSYQVGIEGRPLDVLKTIALRVFEVLTECETGKSLSPGAAYPIL